MRGLLCGLMLAAAAAGAARADEAPFGYVYTTDPLPKGHWEYEQWNTLRTGKAQGYYTAFDLRNELEYGFTENFTGAFYLNSSYLNMKGVPDPSDTTTLWHDRGAFDVNGASLEMRYRVLNPYKDPIGLSLYVEPEISARSREEGNDEIERAIELKLIFQKNFFEDRLVLALNSMLESEWEREDGVPEKKFTLEQTAGASWRFARGWAAGLEFRNARTYENQTFGRESESAWFLGPNVHYGKIGWWATFTILPQIGGHPRDLGLDANGSEVRDASRALGHFEKLEARLRFGINF